MRDQTVSRITLNDGSVLTKCDQCRTMYSERTPPGDPPCETCWVELLEENKQAAYIYQIVCGQVRTSFNGERDVVVDLDFNAVFNIIDRYPGGVRNKWECFEKVMSVFYHFLREGNKNESS